MAKTLYSQSGKIEYGIKKYTVDTEADKEALNLRTTKMGSKCYVIDTKKWYILNSSNEWIPFVDAGGSGGSGSPFNIKGSVPTIDDLPTEDNAIGDLYIVQEDHSEWVWLTNDEEPNGYWEQLGISVLPETIVAVTEQMNNTQKEQTLDNIGGEPKKFIVTITQNGNTYSADKTFEELEIAYENGNTIVVKDESGMSYPLVDYSVVGTMAFSIIYDGKVKTYSVLFNGVGNTDTWTYSEVAVVDAASVSTAISQMTSQQKSDALDNLGGEPEKLDVTFIESNNDWSCNKTFQQISDAYTANKIVQYYIDRTGYTPTISTDASIKNNEITVTFLFSSLDMPVVYTFILSSNDSITFFASPLKDNTQIVSSATPTITPIPNNIYKCGELTSLTITDPTATGAYSIVFISGSTATTTTIPSTILGLESFAAEANTLYEINVLDNRAVVGSWAVTP